MNAPLIIGYPPAGSTWVLHPPEDPWGEGYVVVMQVELHDQGLTARRGVDLAWPTHAQEPDLVIFFEQLADDWRGWEGERSWRSLDATMRITARHDGKGHVSLGGTLRQDSYSPDGWLARVFITVEAGEQMTSLVADLRAHFEKLAR
ncbi:hypothetical protein JMF97_26805 [Micromonospora fiedleri]|uniref:Immunity protein 53 n=1 Tax=Micromonospora fiedleri TaxID=1157498 RepID=A0ABS1UTS1_9ACTN|nr:DUF6228 family protein [Micromonospora fiedleri]MBL6279770.1 hypothetical protein [Micromonospora fiedleri]